MIKFEEHDGMLFRMLEEPVPCESQLKWNYIAGIAHDKPLLIRTIPKIINPRVSIKTLNDLSKVKYVVHYDMLAEIIGTFVEEGSADWAWHQMMKGEKIKPAEMIPQRFYVNKKERFYAIKKGCNYCAFYESDGSEVCTTPISKRRTYSEFIEYSKMWGILSWEIYKEPKPLLADAGIGDIVKTNLGDWLQIVDTPCLRFGHDECYRTHDGLYWDECGVCAVDSTYRLVAVEPLAPEGTAEWAWQMNKLLGKKVMHSHSSWITDGNITHENKGMFIAVTFNTGWQLCEPKEEQQPAKEPIANCKNCKHVCTNNNIDHCHMYEQNVEPPKEPDYVICKRCDGSKSIPNTTYTICPKCGGTGYEIKDPFGAPNPESATQTSLPVSDATQLRVGDCRIEFVKQELHNLLDKI